MDTVIKEMVDFFARILSPGGEVEARNFVQNPLQTASSAAGQSVTAAQLQTAYTAVAPASVALGGGDPVVGMQQAVANTHGIAFAPVRQTEVEALSNNDLLSHNDTRLLSPETNIDHSVDLEFGDITFGDKNTAEDGSVINTGTAGDIDNTNVEGDGNVVGDDNDGNVTGDIETGNNSPVIIGDENDVEVEDNDVNSGGGDVVQNEDGTVIKDVDASGGDGGGGLLGGGGGGGGGIVVDSSTNTGGGDVTNVDTGGGDISGGVDASHDDNSSNSHNTDNSTTDNSVHEDNDVTQTVNQGNVDIF